MQYSPQYLIQAKTKLKVYFDSMVYCQNRDVTTAVKDMLAETFLSIKIQMVKRL